MIRNAFSTLGPAASLITSPSEPLRVMMTRKGLAAHIARPAGGEGAGVPGPMPRPSPIPRPAANAISAAAAMTATLICFGFMARPFNVRQQPMTPRTRRDRPEIAARLTRRPEPHGQHSLHMPGWRLMTEQLAVILTGAPATSARFTALLGRASTSRGPDGPATMTDG